MIATVELRRLLDERGVEWWEEDGHTLWYGQSINHAASAFSSFMLGENDKVHLSAMVTPEQAIAATLGDDEYERKMDALLCRLTNGKFSKTRAYDLDFMESVVREEFETYAATLGRGECHADETDTMECVCDGIGHYGEYLMVHVMECSECGRTYEHVWGNYEYCPHCGRKVVDE